VGSSGGRQGGAAPTSTSTPLCTTPQPVGALQGCSTGVSSGSGAPPQCASSLCDTAGNEWSSLCQDQGCQCLFNRTLRLSPVSPTPARAISHQNEAGARGETLQPPTAVKSLPARQLSTAIGSV